MLQSMEEENVPEATNQNWREPYKAALVEVNPTKARKKIDLACQAILQRIDELAGVRDASAIEEQLEILDSLNKLRKIQSLESQGSTDATQPPENTAQGRAL
jgi:hypothetical protein